MAKNVTKSQIRLIGVSSRAWEHPADRGALVALRKLKGFDTVLKTLSGAMVGGFMSPLPIPVPMDREEALGIVSLVERKRCWQ